MLLPTINPYPLIGKQFKTGLDAIIAALPGSPTITDLVAQVYNYIKPLYYPSITLSQQVELESVIYTAINSYMNAGINGMYSGSQASLANMLIGPSFINTLTVDTLDDRVLDVEDNITKNNLSFDQQSPLLLATVIGATSYTYWLAQIALGGASAWTAYLTPALSSAKANVPFWTASSMEGALIGARISPRGLISPTTDIVSVEIISALTMALTINTGKVVFQWVPRIQSNGMVKA